MHVSEHNGRNRKEQRVENQNEEKKQQGCEN
jgi:hypothetical protein